MLVLLFICYASSRKRLQQLTVSSFTILVSESESEWSESELMFTEERTNSFQKGAWLLGRSWRLNCCWFIKHTEWKQTRLDFSGLVGACKATNTGKPSRWTSLRASGRSLWLSLWSFRKEKLAIRHGAIKPALVNAKPLGKCCLQLYQRVISRRDLRKREGSNQPDMTGYKTILPSK